MQNLADARRWIGDYFTRAFCREITNTDEPLRLKDANDFPQVIVARAE